MPIRRIFQGREKKPGRMIVCSNCACSTAKGTTQVYRKMVFHFCAVCWQERRAQCCAWMQGVCGSTPVAAIAKVAACLALAVLLLKPMAAKAQASAPLVVWKTPSPVFQISNAQLVALLRCNYPKDTPSSASGPFELCAIEPGHTLTEVVDALSKQYADLNANLAVIREELVRSTAANKAADLRLAACDADSAEKPQAAQKLADLQGVIERQKRDIETLKQQLAASAKR